MRKIILRRYFSRLATENPAANFDFIGFDWK